MLVVGRCRPLRAVAAVGCGAEPGEVVIRLVVVEVGKVVVGRQKITTWQQSQHCLVIFWNMLGGMVYEVQKLYG